MFIHFYLVGGILRGKNLNLFIKDKIYDILYLEGLLVENKKKFDKRKYDIEYIKTHKKQFKVNLDISLYDELDLLLKEKKITKVTFIKNAFDELKKK